MENMSIDDIFKYVGKLVLETNNDFEKLRKQYLEGLEEAKRKLVEKDTRIKELEQNVSILQQNIALRNMELEQLKDK